MEQVAHAREAWRQIRQQVLARDHHQCVSCGDVLASPDADIHHLLPRSMGGTDELANLITLCDGCHAAHHPNLAGGLARRVIERWAIQLARWLDRYNQIAEETQNLGPALRLFGVDRLRDGQLEVVQAALQGKSVLVVCPTGWGKSLCFQLPAVLRPGISMVVSPLKALMSEQVSGLLRTKIPATFINSDLSFEEKRLRYGLLRRVAVKFLFLAPERFFVRNDSERAYLQRSHPSYLVIDEAHCIDQWGRDFRPEYGWLGAVRNGLGKPPVLAFTATAGVEMQQRILASLGIEDAAVFVRGVDRPNIALLRKQVSRSGRSGQIAKMLALPSVISSRAMIFVPTVKIGNELQEDLKAAGLDVPFYHSKLGTAWERQELVKRFSGQSRPEVRHIICTNAFGMGLDIPDVRLVIHWQHSSSVEDQLQELGRAGRDRLPAVSVILHDDVRLRPNEDAKLLRFMADRTSESSGSDVADTAAIREWRHKQIDAVQNLVGVATCLRQAMIAYFEGPRPKVRVSLAQRLIGWLFASRQRNRRYAVCCDVCERKEVERDGLEVTIERILAGSMAR